MPEVGEIRRGYEVGMKGSHKLIYAACEGCGKLRWAKLRKGKPIKTLCSSCCRRGKRSSQWRGGRILALGYVFIRLQPDDFFYPMCSKRSKAYVQEHRLVMAKHLGRCLHPWELVHHKGTKYPAGSIENRSDNRIENLQLISDERHKQITILESRITYLEQRVTLIEAENIVLRKQFEERNESIKNT